MSNIKNIYIKAPKKSVNNKHLKLVVKKSSLKKINHLKNDFTTPLNMLKQKEFMKNRDSSIKIVKQNQKPIVQQNQKPIVQQNEKSSAQQNQKPIVQQNEKSSAQQNQSLLKKSLRKNKRTFSRNKVYKKRNNIRKNKTKVKERYVRLIIDSNKEVKGRLESKKKFQKTLNNMSKKKLRRVLINKGLIKKNSRAPSKLLTDIYLNSKIMGDINVIKS